MNKKSGDEGTAYTIGALLGLLRPNWLQADAHGRKNRHVQDRKDIFGKLFGNIHFDSHAAETEIDDARAAGVVLAEHGIGVGAGHGDALGLTLHGVHARG